MKFIRAGIVIGAFFLATQIVSAVTLTIDQYPNTFDQNQEIDVGFTLLCSNCSASYIRGAFFPGGTNYFGFTKNNSGDWIGTTTDKTQYFQIAKEDMTGSSWSGILKVKLDLADSAYAGPGIYSFKLGRYTSADSSALWSGDVAMTVTGPTPTNTNTPSPSPTPSLTPAPTTAPTGTPTKTPTSKPSNTPSSTSKKTPVPTEGKSSSGSSLNRNETSEVLGAKTDTIASSSVSSARQPSYRVWIITFLFVGIGCAILSLAIVFRKQFFESTKSQRMQDNIL